MAAGSVHHVYNLQLTNGWLWGIAPGDLAFCLAYPVLRETLLVARPVTGDVDLMHTVDDGPALVFAETVLQHDAGTRLYKNDAWHSVPALTAYHQFDAGSGQMLCSTTRLAAPSGGASAQDCIAAQATAGWTDITNRPDLKAYLRDEKRLKAGSEQRLLRYFSTSRDTCHIGADFRSVQQSCDIRQSCALRCN